MPVLAIVGRPNVGKSSLLNRIVGRRAAVVDDEPGVTRDRNYVQTRWDGLDFLVTDTGGMLPPSADTMVSEIRAQVETAVAEADAIVFVVDATCPPTDVDMYVARYLHRKAPGRVVMAANKSESPKVTADLSAFMQLGLGEPLAVSALHGKGIAALLDRVRPLLANCRDSGRNDAAEGVRVAILGRPNAGKSSLVNRLVGSKRMIVHEQPGTTRDAIDTTITYYGKPIVLIDTAGLRKKSHVRNRVEYYSNLRAMDSIGRSDVCVLVVDASLGVAEQDLRILQHIEKQGRGMILCLNKWDLVEKDHRTFDDTVQQLRARYMQLRYAPVLAVSALTGQRVPQILATALRVRERMTAKVPQGRLRVLVREWTLRNPHPIVSGKPVHILGAKQVPATHPVFLVFAGNHQLAKPSYGRYLANCIQEEFDFLGCPVTVSFRPPGVQAAGRQLMHRDTTRTPTRQGA